MTRKHPAKPTQARLKELFSYNEDGSFTRLITAPNYQYVAGEVVKGNKPGPNGYLRLVVDGYSFYMHQAVFLWHHGYLPEMIDHDDRNKQNNRVGNLLPSDASHNGHNRGAIRKSITGVKGVTVVPGQVGFKAQRTMLGQAYYLGMYKTIELASKALDEFDSKHGLNGK